MNDDIKLELVEESNGRRIYNVEVPDTLSPEEIKKLLSDVKTEMSNKKI